MQTIPYDVSHAILPHKNVKHQEIIIFILMQVAPFCCKSLYVTVASKF